MLVSRDITEIYNGRPPVILCWNLWQQMVKAQDEIGRKKLSEEAYDFKAN